MNSTSTSNLLLNCQNVSLHYKIDKYQKDRLRNKVVDSFNNLFSGNSGHQSSQLAVIENLNLVISKGERVGIIGLNGAGKTSLCRLIAGIIHPTSGKINSYGEIRAIFNTSVGILPELTGRENAELLTHILYPDESEENINKIVEDCIEFCELGKFIDVPFSKYSRGMQARLSLALVTAKSCDIIVLDEVFDGADEPFQFKMRTRVERIIKESGASLLVSHQMGLVESYCNRVILLGNKGIIFDGDPTKAIERFRQLSPLERRLDF